MFVQLNGFIKLAEVGLNTGNIDVLTDERVNWATKTDNGEVVYTDHMDRFWISRGMEFQPIQPLEKQGGDNKRFIVRNNIIFGMNNQYELWRYDLNLNEFEIIHKLSKNIDNITDIKNQQLLVTKRQVANKEVVELLLEK